MKNLLYIMFMAFVATGVSSCSDDPDNPYDQKSSISVIKQDLDFSAQAAVGTIEVEAPNGISKVTSTASWCTTTVEGTTIKVSVLLNESLEGRSSRITVWSGADSTVVVAQQAGIILAPKERGDIIMTDNATKASYAFLRNVEPTITSTADWLHASLTSDSLKIDADANTTSHLRIGYIKYTSGSFTDSLKVVQCEFDKDIVGNYYLYGPNLMSTDNENIFLEGEVRKNGTGIVEFHIPSLNLTLPLTYDNKKLSLTAAAGTALGTYILNGTTTYAFLRLYSTTWTINSAVKMNLFADYRQDFVTAGYEGTVFRLTSADVAALALSLFASDSPSSRVKDTLIAIDNPRLIKR